MTRRIGICLMAYPGPVSGGTAFTFAEAALEASRMGGVCLDRQTEQPTDRARNLAVKTALEGECTHLLMMDADCYVEPGQKPLATLLAGMEETGATVIGAAVVMRGHQMVNVPRWQGEASYPVDRVGSGIMLIDLRKIGAGPWFRFELNEDGTEVVTSEDFWFCRKVRAEGGVVAACTKLHTRHDHVDPLRIERLTVKGG